MLSPGFDCSGSNEKERNLANSPEWGPENKSDKKERKVFEGEIDVVLPQAKKVKLGEPISCHRNLAATSGSLVFKEETKDDNMELKEEPKDEYIEELMEGYVENKKNPK